MTAEIVGSREGRRQCAAASMLRTCATKAPSSTRGRGNDRRRGGAPLPACRSRTSRWTARAAGAPARGRWRLIDAARGRGVDVEADQTPTRPPARRSASAFPSWALEGGQTAHAARLNDPGHLGEHQERDPRPARRARAFRSLVRRRRVVPRRPVVERPVDEAGRREARGGDTMDAQLEAARADARRRRGDGLPLHVRRRRGADHAAFRRRRSRRTARC